MNGVVRDRYRVDLRAEDDHLVALQGRAVRRRHAPRHVRDNMRSLRQRIAPENVVLTGPQPVPSIFSEAFLGLLAKRGDQLCPGHVKPVDLLAVRVQRRVNVLRDAERDIVIVHSVRYDRTVSEKDL